ncbi:MAG: glycoside hydrolase, partial [Verrucomicrobia bacterium]|nr:glycoside hydrolase [Verrucomicrobiota bacterium]
VRAAVPARWISRGPGGGGALFGPAISPHHPETLYADCDMSGRYRSLDLGRSWETLSFLQVQGGTLGVGVQFTSRSNVLYALDFSTIGGVDAVTPSKSTDGGQTWTRLANDPTDGDAWSLFADETTTNRLLVSGYSNLYFSTNGGGSFTDVFSTDDLLVAGAFFDGSNIFVGTRVGLLVSTNGGAGFALPSISGIPAGEAMISLAGAKEANTTRLFCVTLDTGDVYPGVTGAEHWSYRGVYRLDVGPGAAWVPVTSGISPDHLFFVATCRSNIHVAYAAGALDDPTHPVVYKTTNGGGAWNKVFRPVDNENIFTGWQGDGGDRSWWYGEYALGFTVCRGDPDRAAITDLGFIHLTTNGGVSWQQAYVYPGDQHPTNAPTPERKYYHGVGAENTSAWWLTWDDSNRVFACFTDIQGVRSTNGGVTWGFDYTGLDMNSTYQSVRHPSNESLYVSVSSVHDLYQSTYLQDGRIDGGDGGILFSTNHGANWSWLHDFNHPVAGLALDPNDPRCLYAAVVNSTNGGIYVTTNLQDGAASKWNRLAVPPRTEAHPYLVHVLQDGTLVCSYSARRTAAGAFTASAGVFVSTNRGASWLDRTAAGMMYWTKDLVPDLHDAGQSNWYACVWSGWGGPPNGLGGLYRTTNRGLAWTRINSLDRVESCTVDPANPQALWLSTETEGLWYTTNLQAATPTFLQVTNYPFRHPVRMFLNPFDTNEMWITSFGNGLRVGRITEPAPELTGLQEVPAGAVCVTARAEAGQEVILQTASTLMSQNWVNTATGTVLDSELIFEGVTPGFYRAAISP